MFITVHMEILGRECLACPAQLYFLCSMYSVQLRALYCACCKPQLAFCCSFVGTIDFCPSLAAQVTPVQNIMFLTAHFFTFSVPIAHQPGQAGVQGRLSLCLWSSTWCTLFLQKNRPMD